MSWVPPWKRGALGPLRPLVLKTRSVGITAETPDPNPVYDPEKNDQRRLLKAFELDADNLARAGVGSYLYTLFQSYDGKQLARALLAAEQGTFVTSMPESAARVRLDGSSGSSTYESTTSRSISSSFEGSTKDASFQVNAFRWRAQTARFQAQTARTRNTIRYLRTLHRLG